MKSSLKEIVDQLREFSTSELCDGCEEYHTMDYHIQRQISDKKIVGPAYTVDVTKGVSGLVADALLAAEQGYVLVVAGKECCGSAYWGDHRSLCASMKGLEAVIIDGAFRDLEGCKEIGFPIFARNVTPGSCKKQAEGQLNVPIVCGGVHVDPDDLIIGDSNGVLVIKPEEALSVMEKAKKKIMAQEYTEKKMKETNEILPRMLKGPFETKN